MKARLKQSQTNRGGAKWSRMVMPGVVIALASTMLGGCQAFMQGYAEGLAGGGSSESEATVDVAFDLSPDGKRLIFSGKGTNNDQDLYLLDLKTLHVSQISSSVDTEYNPVFSNDGRSALYSASVNNSAGSYIFYRSLESKTRKRLTATPKRSDAMPRYSPDGSQIVFVRAHRYGTDSEGEEGWLEWEVYLISKDGSQPRRVTREKYESITAPRFSRDGSTIYYSAVYPGAKSVWKVYSIKLGRGQKPKLLVDVKGKKEFYSAGSNPDLSPDGKRMVYSSDRLDAYEYELYLSNRDGSRARRITWHRSYTELPCFTRDGRYIYYLLDPEYDDNYELWRTGIDGKGARRIADSGLFSDPLNWKKKAK